MNWRLEPTPHGFYRLSRARIIGQPSTVYAKHWREIDQGFHGKCYGHHLNRFLHSVFASFRLFFLDWFNRYLTCFTSARYDGKNDVYLATGPAQGPAVRMKSQIGTATIKLDGIITIALEQIGNGGVYEWIVIEAYRYTRTAPNTDTYLRLYDSAGNLIIENDNKSWSDLFSRIDLKGTLKSGIYYIQTINSEASPNPASTGS